MSIGEQLLVSGAEVGRVEDTIRRICLAYGAERADVFSITSSIVTTIYGADFGVCTQTRRVSGMVNDLDRVDQLNQLSREICQEKPTHEEIKEKLIQIQNRPHYSFGMQLLIYALVSGSFSVFFGGDWKDMAASAIIGVLLKFIEAFVKKGSVNSLITALICSTVGGFLANLAVYSGIGDHADLISIGNIMLLIPGAALYRAMNCLMYRNYAGFSKEGTYTLLFAASMSAGITFTTVVFRMIWRQLYSSRSIHIR